MPNTHSSMHTSLIHQAAILLIGLTCLTTAISYFPLDALAENTLLANNGVRMISIALILLMTMIKGMQIVDVFMEMRTAPRSFRLFTLSYPVIIPVLLTAILYL
jgi:cytochrome c oxidase subunit IV